MRQGMGRQRVIGLLLGVVLGSWLAASVTAQNYMWGSINGVPFAQAALFGDGSAAAPSIAFTSDTDTGIYSAGAGTFAFAVNGSRKGYWGTSGLTLDERLLWSSDGGGGLGGSTTANRPGWLNVGGRAKTAEAQPIVNLAETWNNAAVAFAGIKYVITDTDSASASLPFQILGGASGTTNLFKLDKTGSVTAALNFNNGAGQSFQNIGRGGFYMSADGGMVLHNTAFTGFTTLNLGPTTGNTANGTLSITKTTTTCTIDTDTGCTGKTTNVVTMTSGSLPAASLILGVTCKNTVAITGSAGFLTYSVGDGSDVDRWGTSIAKALNTTTNIANYTTASPAYQSAAGSLVFGANGAETFTAGQIACTVYSINFTPIGS